MTKIEGVMIITCNLYSWRCLRSVSQCTAECTVLLWGSTRDCLVSSCSLTLHSDLPAEYSNHFDSSDVKKFELNACGMQRYLEIVIFIFFRARNAVDAVLKCISSARFARLPSRPTVAFILCALLAGGIICWSVQSVFKPRVGAVLVYIVAWLASPAVIADSLPVDEGVAFFDREGPRRVALLARNTRRAKKPANKPNVEMVISLCYTMTQKFIDPTRENTCL